MPESQDDPKSMLTAKEAAERLRISRNHLYELLAANIIPCRRVGRRGGKILISEAAIRAYWGSTLQTTPIAPPEPEVRSAGKFLRPPPAPSRRRP